MSGRTRVLMIVGRLDEGAGGGERAVVGLGTSLPRDRYEVTVCTTRPSGGAPVRALEQAGVYVVDLHRHRRVDIKAIRRMLVLVRSGRFDVVHGHMYGSNLWAVVFGRLFRVPVVIAHEQTWDYVGQPLRKLLDGIIGRLSNAFIAVSMRDAERMVKLERVPAGRIVVVPNAWAPRPNTASGDLRRELGLTPEVPVISTVAVMRPQKRLQVLIDAFALVRARVPEAVLVLVGDGPCRGEIEARVAEHGLGDSVRFVGMREDVETIWRGSDLAAMSSDFEGTPLAALEAMSFGVPLVSTDVGGLPDIAGDPPEHGVVLVPARDAAALAQELEALLHDPAERRRLGAAARRRAEEFTADRHAMRCAALYDELLSRSRRR